MVRKIIERERRLGPKYTETFKYGEIYAGDRNKPQTCVDGGRWTVDGDPHVR
jgi:hypothetical protein